MIAKPKCYVCGGIGCNADLSYYDAQPIVEWIKTKIPRPEPTGIVYFHKSCMLWAREEAEQCQNPLNIGI